MHEITLFEDLRDATGKVSMEAGAPYVVETNSVPDLARLVEGKVNAEPIDIAKGGLAEFQVNGTAPRILVCRAGGAGDILFVTPLLRELRRLFPGSVIGLACWEKFGWIAAPLVDEVVPFPLPAHTGTFWDWIIDLENAVEEAQKRHVVDAFADRAGVSVADRTVCYSPVTDPREFAARFPRKPGMRRVALGVHSTAPCRDYPQIDELYGTLVGAGYEVVLYGDPTKNPAHPGVYNTIDLTRAGMPWQWNVDFLTTCDAAVGPDSSMIYFAAALGVPTVGLFGPIPHHLRTAHEAKIKAIQGTGPCAPCHHHGRRNWKFPPNCPSGAKGYCQVLADVTVEGIMRQIKRKLVPAEAAELRRNFPAQVEKIDAAEAEALAELEAVQ